eukprot:CAMPEP_0204917102 /NCGR_PEP_ID=MMETSP1397-20131031/14782_1 /ASSEMBLY_ACC=CAM_ASM_000891 /TAXON_ID=49980 /ORGANISM="Climacostomum Climacostomum virens, Strain Stock W-24" /LENGTH=253 /DNA_ID=CAMNT_0052089857 /DNA_START=145 /DNA_END=906 /DNA_ORIENTATION=-
MQVKHFNQSRFLEMEYYIISFYFLIRIIYSIVLGVGADIRITLALELVPNTLVFTICSVMTYLWVTIIWEFEPSWEDRKLLIARMYAGVNLTMIGAFLIALVASYILVGLIEATLLFLFLSMAVYLTIALFVFLIGRKLFQVLRHLTVNSSAIAKNTKSAIIIVCIGCMVRATTSLGLAIILIMSGEPEAFIGASELKFSMTALHVLYMIFVDIILIIAITHLLEAIDLRKTTLLINKMLIEDENSSISVLVN